MLIFTFNAVKQSCKLVGSLLNKCVVCAQPPATGPGAPVPPQSTDPAPAQARSVAVDALSPELFTGIVQGVLSTMMSSLGTQQGNGESIAQFIQRLSQTSNLFTPGSGDGVGELTLASESLFCL